MAKAAPRHRARDVVFRALYAVATGQESPKETFDQLLAEEELVDRNRDFAIELFDQVRAYQEEADEHIRRLARNWELERIALIDRIILRLALTELTKRPDIPMRVAINEAIELAKVYSTPDSPSFVNGILDSYVKQSTPAEGR